MIIRTHEQAVALAQNFKISEIWLTVFSNFNKFVGLFTNAQYLEFIEWVANEETAMEIIVKTSTSIDENVMAAFLQKFKSEYSDINLRKNMLHYVYNMNFCSTNFANFIKYIVPTEKEMRTIIRACGYMSDSISKNISEIYKTT